MYDRSAPEYFQGVISYEFKNSICSRGFEFENNNNYRTEVPATSIDIFFADFKYHRDDVCMGMGSYR